MSDVEFTEGGEPGESTPVYTSRKILGEQAVPGMAGNLVKLGVVKSEPQAYKVLIVIVIICIVASIYFLLFFNRQGSSVSREESIKRLQDAEQKIKSAETDEF